MSLIRIVAAAAMLAAAAPVLAQDSAVVIEARQSGIAGERFDGYMGFAAPPSEIVRRQVSAINIRRRSLYTGLASRRNANVQEVGITAGCELLEGVRIGESYMLSDGVWRKRGAGEAPPVPSYCRAISPRG